MIKDGPFHNAKASYLNIQKAGRNHKKVVDRKRCGKAEGVKIYFYKRRMKKHYLIKNEIILRPFLFF